MDTKQTTAIELKRLSRWLDSSIRLPGGMRIGWDGVIGLLPGVGDLAGLAISSYIIFSAAKLGASKLAILRMVLNVVLEAAIGTIPIAGDLFDMAFKANNRNMALLDRHTQDPRKVTTQSRWWLLGWLTILFAIFVFVVWLVVRMLAGLLAWLF
ncbi:MAG: DUF4112 domain-containing protein [Granulosicoccus sp.]|nr:DUF4112 domain-containing protein [Granulosicoccus sp.]